MRKKSYALNAAEGDDPEGDPNRPFDEYYPSGCSWLKHRLLELTNNLGDVTKHYRPPMIKDAPGYDDRRYGDSCYDDDTYYDKESGSDDRGGHCMTTAKG